MEYVAEIFAREGADAWWTRPAAELVPPGVVCSGCGAGPDKWEKEHNIVDVWFESGVSWLAIADQSPDHADIDLYLEGSDQHRGWFHSSLLAGIGVGGKAPYKQVLTHGFVLDENGYPLSKSAIARAKAEGKKTSYVEPEEAIKKLGTEMLRMWVGSTDFRGDIPYSQQLVEGLSEWYRKLRNTVRWALGALDRFVSAGEAADRAHVAQHGLAVDRFMLARVDDLVARCRESYDAYEFHGVHRAMVDFVTVELSALYADVSKDRLYLDARDAPRRRAAQVVLYEALRAVTTLIAPIMVFTAEELWGYLPKRDGDPDSVHLATYPAGARLADDDERVREVELLLGWRERVTKALEPFRAAKHKSLDARVRLIAPGDSATLRKFADELADLMIVSGVEIAEEAGEPRVEVAEHGGARCERCWKWYAALAAEPNDVCQRCADALVALKG
jgi:isoleucyl-tRNA synthetase